MSSCTVGCIILIKFRRKKLMKATGVVRKIDELGRIVIPMELRKTMCLNEGAHLAIYVDEDYICLKKYPIIEPLNSALENMKKASENLKSSEIKQSILAEITIIEKLMKMAN
jgi:transcriptional pleiotropic regulator of transition state genes